MKKQLVACEIGPNYTIHDGFVALKTLLQIPFLSIFGLPNDIKSTSDYFQKHQLIKFVDSGRVGLVLLLKSLNLPDDSEVLIQGFSCVVVPNSVIQAGLKTVVCDINEDNYNISLDYLESKKTKKTRVLIIQYTFGIIPNLEHILKFCESNNIILIEDCAHILNEKVIIFGKERCVGTLGYGSLYSFGRDKVVSSTIGGAFALNSGSESQIKYLESCYNELQNTPPSKIYQALLYCILSVFLIRPFYFYGFGKLTLVLGRRIHLIGEIYTLSEKKGTAVSVQGYRFPDILLPLLHHQLGKLKQTKIHRLKIMKIYSSILKNKIDLNSPLIRYPLNVSEDSYLKIKSALRKQSVLVGTWYNSIFIPSEADLKLFGYKDGDAKVCEKLVKNRVLNLPTNINTSPKKALEIAKTIESVLAVEPI